MPRAEGIAPPEVHLGERLDVEWQLDHGGREVTNVSLTMRIAATVPLPDPQASERRPFFLTLPLAPYGFRGTLLALEWTLELVALPGEEKPACRWSWRPGGAPST